MLAGSWRGGRSHDGVGVQAKESAVSEASAAARWDQTSVDVMIDLDVRRPVPRAGVVPLRHRVVEYRLGRYERFVKPVIDRVGAAVLLLALSPVMVLVALMVRFSLGSPAVFRQRRVGRYGETFTVLKFRTMMDDRRREQRSWPHGERRMRHKTPDDPRITGVGSTLRRWSLDELPQLVNVLRGEMSLVGPRPELVELVQRHYQPWQLQRHLIKPGITGLWQISARSDGLIYENVDLDLDYVEQVSLRTDLRILFGTAKALVGRLPGF